MPELRVHRERRSDGAWCSPSPWAKAASWAASSSARCSQRCAAAPTLRRIDETCATSGGAGSSSGGGETISLDLAAYDTAPPLVAATNGFRAPMRDGSESGESTEIVTGKALTPDSEGAKSPKAAAALVLALD